MSPKWVVPVLTYLCMVQGRAPCTTPDGKRGDCKSITMCDSLRGMANKPGVTREEIDFLRRSACGFDDTIPKVCCPLGCVTWENHTVAGQCVNVYDCDHIKKRLAAPPVPQEYKDYVNGLRCGGDANFSVCCEPLPSSESVPTLIPTRPSSPPMSKDNASSVPGNSASCTMSAQPPDPASGCCGLGGPSPKIFGGSATGLDQYPWLALIEYERDYKIVLLCGGVLISGRYVLTAGHCVVGPKFRKVIPKNVRLGEYDTANEGRDCEELDGGDEDEEECTLDPVSIPIEQIIPHADYDSYKSTIHNDIAMLRLASIPAYTDFVRPICLPTVDITTNFPESKGLYVAGWGAVGDKIPHYSNIKQHVKLPYKSLEVCRQNYNALDSGHRIRLWDHQMCAGGQLGKDACMGDSGGPLMYYVEMNNTKSHYELIGIVSFGFYRCGVENVPGVYTKVFKYMSWIRSNIRN